MNPTQRSTAAVLNCRHLKPKGQQMASSIFVTTYLIMIKLNGLQELHSILIDLKNLTIKIALKIAKQRECCWRLPILFVLEDLNSFEI